MTDATNFFKTVVSQTSNLTLTLDSVRLLADRISADSSLSAEAAAAAAAGGRSDLTAADFDNFNAAVGLIENLLNSNNAAVNTATVKLAFYKLL